MSEKEVATVTDRITVVETVYHQSFGGEPTCSESKYTKILETMEQPFKRDTKCTEEWDKLDAGWLDECSLLVISNKEGSGLQSIPTEDEKLDIAMRVIEISGEYDIGSVDGPEKPVPHFEICPGESFRGCPVELKKLYIRCRYETARYSLTVFPK